MCTAKRSDAPNQAKRDVELLNMEKVEQDKTLLFIAEQPPALI